jgi:polar amino acid transport system substrate-binding protein
MNKRRTLLAALGASTLVTPCISIGQQAGKVWRVGYAPFGTPLSFLPGATPQNYKTLDASTGQGAMVELQRALAKDIGYQIQFVALVAGELAEAIASNKIDIRTIAPMNLDQTFMDITQPVYNDSEVLIANKSDSTPYASYTDLRGMVIGSRAGTVSENDLKTNGLETKSYASFPEMLKAVESGEVKVAVNTSYIPTAHILSRSQYPGVKIVMSYRPRLPAMAGIGVRKGEGELLSIVNTSLKKLKADGTVRAIFAQYGIADALVK